MKDGKAILSIEDKEDDVFMMKRALKLALITQPLQVVVDGQQALDYLSGAGDYGNREQCPLPFLVFLDLKLPYVHGFEVLSWIRQRRELDFLLVVVLTSSAEERDHAKAYALGARSYLVKPPRAEAVKDIFKSLETHWGTEVGA